jgi:hypothetical protein
VAIYSDCLGHRLGWDEASGISSKTTVGRR